MSAVVAERFRLRFTEVGSKRPAAITVHAIDLDDLADRAESYLEAVLDEPVGVRLTKDGDVYVRRDGAGLVYGGSWAFTEPDGTPE